MEPLKEALNENFVFSIIDDLSHQSKIHASTIKKGFSELSNWSRYELKDRTHLLAQLIFETADHDFPKAVKWVNAIAPKYSGLQGFIFPAVVEKYGLEYFELSMDTLHHITRYSTGEFAIRPFLQKYEQTWEVIHLWKEDENEHVRRLASEGCRPLLPWGIKLHQLVQDPTPIMPVLTHLFSDDSEYVRKSVANNLNDISKNQPALVKQFCRQQVPQNERQKRIIAHGLRTLLKNGNEEAYPLIGYRPDIVIKGQIKGKYESISKGNEQFFQAHLSHDQKNKTPLFINLIVYFPRKNKSPLRKVFFWKKLQLQSKQKLELDKKIRFKDLSTRKIHIGSYKAELQVNGKVIDTFHFHIND